MNTTLDRKIPSAVRTDNENDLYVEYIATLVALDAIVATSSPNLALIRLLRDQADRQFAALEMLAAQLVLDSEIAKNHANTEALTSEIQKQVIASEDLLKRSQHAHPRFAEKAFQGVMSVAVQRAYEHMKTHPGTEARIAEDQVARAAHLRGLLAPETVAMHKIRIRAGRANIYCTSTSESG